MACVNPDGSLTASGRAILQALRASGSAPSIAASTGLPLYRVRSALRDLVAVGLAEPAGEAVRLTATGEARLGS